MTMIVIYYKIMYKNKHDDTTPDWCSNQQVKIWPQWVVNPRTSTIFLTTNDENNPLSNAPVKFERFKKDNQLILER